MSAAYKLILLIFLAPTAAVFSQTSFRLVPLGVGGGIDESNLSAYMLAPGSSNNFICLDAGTLYFGAEKAVASHAFDIPAEQVIRKYIKAYLISHAHLDHLAGLIIGSPEDTAKNIYGLASCIQTIKSHYFTWESWANFADEGQMPQLKKYHYKILTPGAELPLENTEMTVRAFPLSHSNVTSTAFLVQSKGNYLLYLGDTGPDKIEKSHKLENLWKAIAPLIAGKKLKAILIEVSFADEQPDGTLFGHLTPRWLMREMADLEQLSGKGSLNGFNIIVTHLKPPHSQIEQIKKQLSAENSLQLHLIYPLQGQAIDF